MSESDEESENGPFPASKGQRFVLSKRTPEGPVDYVYLYIRDGQAYNSKEEAIDSREAAEVFLDYIRAAFDEEASQFGTIKFSGLLKFDLDGTLGIADELLPEIAGEDTSNYTIMGVYAEPRKKLDVLLQLMAYKAQISEMEEEIEKLRGEIEFFEERESDNG